MNQGTITKRYHNIVKSATPADFASAGAWYANANAIATQMSYTYNIDIERAAGVIAAFSPRVHWSRNVNLAHVFLKGDTPSCLGRSIKSAKEVLKHGISALKGPKTNAFARNIAGDLSAVTVDSWMMKAAGYNTISPNNTQYRAIEKSVKVLANRYDVEPAVMQALIWIKVRGRSE